MGPDRDQSSALYEHGYNKRRGPKTTFSGPNETVDGKLSNVGPQRPLSPLTRIFNNTVTAY